MKHCLVASTLVVLAVASLSLYQLSDLFFSQATQSVRMADRHDKNSSSFSLEDSIRPLLSKQDVLFFEQDRIRTLVDEMRRHVDKKLGEMEAQSKAQEETHAKLLEQLHSKKVASRQGELDHVGVAAADPFPTSTSALETTLHCVGMGRAKTCHYKNLYYEAGAWKMFILGEPPKDNQIMKKVKFEYLWAPESVRFQNAPDMEDYVKSRSLQNETGLAVFHGLLWWHQWGHGMWDGIYPAFAATVNMNMQDRIWLPVMDADGPCNGCIIEDILKTLSGAGRLMKAYEMAQACRENSKLLIRFEELIMGVGGAGNYLVNVTEGNVGLGGPPHYATQQFRDRMLRSHGVSFLPRAQVPYRLTKDIINVYISLNKRWLGENLAAINGLVATLKSTSKYHAEAFFWSGSSFKQQLEKIQKADIYISSVGTSQLMVPFMRDRTVFIHTGVIKWTHWGESTPDAGVYLFPSWMEQHISGGGSPHVKVLFMDLNGWLRNPSSRQNVIDTLAHQSQPSPRGIFEQIVQTMNVSWLLGYVEHATSLLRNGFEIPIPVEQNLSPEARLLRDLCHRRSSEAEEVCRNIQYCLAERVTTPWFEFIVHGVAPWHKASTCNFSKYHHKLLREMREEYNISIKTELDTELPQPPNATLSSTGCPCSWDESRKDCACCNPGFCLCDQKDRCGICGEEWKCVHPWNYTKSLTGCPCYDAADKSCACCRERGCQCGAQSNQGKCVQCNGGFDC